MGDLTAWGGKGDEAGRAGADNRDFRRPGLDATLNDSADATRFVLVGTSHPGNIGAAARAMKVMGFRDLVLVAPRFADVAGRPEAAAMASGATDVLAGARVVGSLGEALAGITFVCATAMTPRDFGPPNHAPRELFPRLAADGQRVAFVFGSERFGLANDDVYACHACLTIPTDPGYGSLNLAQAVQLVAYDWRQACGGFAAPAPRHDARRADAVAVRGLVEHWRATLEAIGFLDPATPRKLMARLHRLANRAGLSEEEVHILRGIARAVDGQRR
jgi:tRNA/rRNA methyltransferase